MAFMIRGAKLKKLGGKIRYLKEKPTRGEWIKKLDALIREICFLRDHGRCQWNCGKTEKLAPHHIKPKGRYTRMRWEIDNVLTLCYQHHLGNGGAHLDGTTFTEWFNITWPDRAVYLRRRAQIREGGSVDYRAIELYLLSQLKKYE